MEDIKVNDQDIGEPAISKTYEIDGCTIVVRRKFEKGGAGILEQVVSLLLDMLDKEEQNKIFIENT